MKHALAAIVLTLAFACQAVADVPPPNVVRVFVEDRDGELSMGTGTLVTSDRIVTNWHVVKDRSARGTIRVLFPNWSLYVAKVVKTDKLWDLAELRIAPVLIPPMELGTKPERGDLVTVGGYGSGWFRSSSGKVLAFYMPTRGAAGDLMQIDTHVRNGDSGGPIIRDGKLVGVLFGNQPDGTYGTHVERVRNFLEK